MEKRSLLDNEMTPPREPSDVFGDEYEVDDFDGVADGFRPMDHDRDGGEDVMDQPVRTMSAHYGNGAVSPAMPNETPNRNSTRKSRGYENPFASVEDGDERAPSMSFEPDMTHRSVSSASSHHFARTSSPRFGAGPSHPYGMYPQGTVARTPSVATQSTIRPPQRQMSTSSRAGPQHPYTLYPQGVSEDVDDEEEISQNPEAVGFPGLGQSYQRRMGPDGEEQDIIGADGHAEQLPPYTRYPEEGAEKVPLLAPAAPTALHSRAPVAGTDPTMDLMHTTLIPQPAPQLRQSMTDQSVLVRHSSMSNVERMQSNMRPASLESNKSWSEKSWKEKRKTRFCGVPVWCYMLAFSVLAFIAIVLGGVIGGFVEGDEKHRPYVLVNFPDRTQTLTSDCRHFVHANSTSLYDASSIATPASGSPATGTYALALSTPQETQVACLPVQAQQPAWSCDIGGLPAAAISVGTPPGSNQSGAFIFYGADEDTISYGTQASFMQTSFAPFMTVQDNEDLESGPAYYFQQTYDKLVVLPESALSASPSNKNKRQGIQLDPGWLQQKQTAQPGDKPWFCVWNNTFLEAFIYVQQPVAPSTNSTSAVVLPTVSLNDSSQTWGSSSPPLTSTTQPPPVSPTQFTTTPPTMTSSTGPSTGPASAFSAWSAHVEQSGQGGSDDDDDTSGHSGKKRQDADELYDTLAVYPYVVKLEERRLAGNPVAPYCQQYQVLDNGGYNWIPDSNGKPVIIELNEQDPSYAAYESAGIAGSSKKLKEKRVVAGGCHCQWMSGQRP
ncbi:hypothetical protein LTR08_008483 [Meristemomyces frigidus]|nr:hypothetical protein LTR08_008483 [Meristemomyces frigidus]